MSRPVWLLALVGLLSGCATPTLYSWGHYEELVYTSYAAPGKVSPEMQVEKLEQDYQEARATNKRMHPDFMPISAISISNSASWSIFFMRRPPRRPNFRSRPCSWTA